MANTAFFARHGLNVNNQVQAYAANGQVTANSFVVGSNVSVNSSSFAVGNSTVNTYVTSTGITAPTISTNSTQTSVSGIVTDAAANVLSQTLTDGATINWDAGSGRIATVTLGAAGRTFANATNIKVGSYILHILQDGTGSRTITTWGGMYKWSAGVAPVLTTTAGARDVVTFICDGTNMYGSYLPDVR